MLKSVFCIETRVRVAEDSTVLESEDDQYRLMSCNIGSSSKYRCQDFVLAMSCVTV
jgi:hypothetical protein